MNLLRDLPTNRASEIEQILVQSSNLRLVRIVSEGQASPPDFWYDQDENEWVLLLAGAARLAFANRVITLEPGDCLNIPAHERHRVEWTSPDQPTVWLAIFYE